MEPVRRHRVPGVVIRPAVPDDAAAMGALHVRAWQAAYRGVMPDDFLDGIDADARAAFWADALSHPPGRAKGDAGPLALLADLRGVVVGMSAVGPNHSDLPGEPGGQLYMFNTDPSVWGTGVAVELHTRSCAELHRMGHEEAVLWVVERNARARRFYEREGWVADGGSQSERYGGVEVAEVRYRCDARTVG